MRANLLWAMVPVVLCSLPLRSQTLNPGRPPEVQAQKVPSADAMMARMHDVQLQKDAKELADLSASIPSDMDGVKRGILPKDLIDKLKKMEKLSKRLREELTR